MNRNRKKTLFLLCFLVFLCVESRAQEVKPAETASHYNWDIGLQGGLPFGISTFNSFGADKTRIGWSTGLYGGYRFNNIFSLDASASFGKTGMSARDCCTDYWLGNDGERYFVPVAGMEGWNYSNLYSRVNLQRYGLHLNVNLLGFFPSTTQNRWSVNLSPAIYGIGSKASIKTISGDKEVLKGNNTWRLGLGGDFSVGYRMTENLSVNLYSGITHLTGKQMDAVSEYHRKSNFVWESGLKLGWTFGKSKKQTQKVISVTPAEIVAKQPEESVQPEDKVEVIVTIPHEEPKKQEEAKMEFEPIRFPIIYFPFNVTTITSAQVNKMHDILTLMRQHPDIHILLTGWCDNRGSKAVNDRISLSRARSVQSWLVKNGIDKGRITIEGKGIDTNETDVSRARRVESEISNRKEAQ